ncbi:hypothetical protein L0Z72_16060, partial [candidate division KSB1 bacterium]|nr:hypothetical protein [candidate division KSB1 bacterium]
MSRINTTITLLIILLFYSELPAQIPKSTQENDQNENLAVGIIDGVLIKNSFINNGGFCEFKYGVWQETGGVFYKNSTYLSSIDLWLGVPEGPWSPRIWDATLQDSVVIGPTVTGSYFQYFMRWGTDWGPPPEARGQHYSGDLLLSDVYPAISSDIDLPLLANSSFPLSLPENIYGNRIWRGDWLHDPEIERTLVGTFRADQEVLFQFTDIGYASNYYPTNVAYIDCVKSDVRGYDIGARVNGSVLIFNDQYAQDFMIVDLTIINQSPWNYKDVYLGLRFNPYNFRSSLNWRYYTRDYSMSYLLEEAVGEATFPYNLAYVYCAVTPTPPDGLFDFVGVKLLDSPANQTDKNKPILTGWHWFNDVGWYKSEPLGGGASRSRLIDHPLKRGEIVQYKLLAGDTTDLIAQEQERFFYPNEGKVNPNFDDLARESLIIEPTTLMSSGPFDWQSGDTVKFAFAVVFGDSLSDLKTNCRVAQAMYDNDYQRMSPPPPPRVQTIAGDRQVTLY